MRARGAWCVSHYTPASTFSNCRAVRISSRTRTSLGDDPVNPLDRVLHCADGVDERVALRRRAVRPARVHQSLALRRPLDEFIVQKLFDELRVGRGGAALLRSERLGACVEVQQHADLHRLIALLALGPSRTRDALGRRVDEDYVKQKRWVYAHGGSPLGSRRLT